MLSESTKRLNKTNQTLGVTHNMLKDQTGKLQQTNQFNKDIESGYNRSNQMLNRIKWQNIAIKGLLVLIIILMGLVDFILLVIKMRKL